MTLASAPIRWPAEIIWQAVEPLLPGFTVEVLPEIDSTNTELMRRFKAGRPEPILLVAEHQNAGRGRMGRSWHGERGKSLTFSLGLPWQPADLSGLSLAVGVSLAESLDPVFATDLRIGLKWPNDLWLCTPDSERKLGGILVETASRDGLRYVIIGMGVNISVSTGISTDASPTKSTSKTITPGTSGLSASPQQPSCPSATPPAGLQELSPGIDAAGALLRVALPLVQAVQAFAQTGFAPLQQRFEHRNVLANRAVEYFEREEKHQGSAQGVGANGALRVLTAAGMKEIISSEVSVRPLAPAGATTATGETARPSC